MTDFIDILDKDYETTLAFIDKCDGHMFMIKNWAVVATSAVVAFAFSKDKHTIILVNIILVLAFLYLELTYKAFQDSVIGHANDIATRIDKYVCKVTESDLSAGYEFGFGRKIKYQDYKSVLRLAKDSKHRYIVEFYVLIVLLSACAFLLGRFVA